MYEGNMSITLLCIQKGSEILLWLSVCEYTTSGPLSLNPSSETVNKPVNGEENMTA